MMKKGFFAITGAALIGAATFYQIAVTGTDAEAATTRPALESSTSDVGKADKAEILATIEAFLAIRENRLIVRDPLRGRDLDMALVKIHDGAWMTGAGTIYACADMRYGDTVYDIDFFLKEHDGRYVIYDYFLHKEAGRDRIRPPKK